MSSVVLVEILETLVGVEITEEVVQITEVALQGIPGPAGADGTSTNDPWQEDTFALSGNQTVFLLSATPRTGTVQMFVNGLRQAISNFSFIGTTLTVAGFTPTTDDDVSFIYQAEV